MEDKGRTPVYTSPPARIVRTEFFGEPILFTVTDPRDEIQKHHAAGRFYEEEELEIIRRWCPPGGVFCDIGANIGNHSLFAVKFLRARHVIPIEPNPAAIELLVSNLVLNGAADACDFGLLGVGLSDRETAGLAVDVPTRNLGGARLVDAAGGTLCARRGDDLLSGRRVDFLKIDVEGMELRVLSGLEETIAASRPRLFIEVDRRNIDAFRNWVACHRYEVVARFRRYPSNINFALLPKR